MAMGFPYDSASVHRLIRIRKEQEERKCKEWERRDQTKSLSTQYKVVTLSHQNDAYHRLPQCLKFYGLWMDCFISYPCTTLPQFRQFRPHFTIIHCKQYPIMFLFFYYLVCLLSENGSSDYYKENSQIGGFEHFFLCCVSYYKC